MTEASAGGEVTPPVPIVVVTTRSHLRSAADFPRMAAASARIRAQLTDAPGIVRWASITAGPREFWTITAWASLHRMQEFMRSDAHGRIMWRFSRWLDSFWLARWRVGQRELGTWEGLALSAAGREDRDPPRRHDPEAAERVFAAIPQLRAAFGGGPAPRYEHAPHVRRHHDEVAGAGALVVRLSAGRRRTPAALRDLRSMCGRFVEHDEVFGAGVGVGQAGDAYLIAPWSDRRALVRFLDAGGLGPLRDRWGEHLWAAQWRAEHEFGQWGGRRLRAEPAQLRAAARELGARRGRGER